jgi:hypothetical protein
MEWLMIIAFVVISIMDSKKKSDQAKQQSAQRRQQMSSQGQRPGELPNMQQRPQSPRPASKPVSKQEGSFMGSLTEFLESLEDALDQSDDHAPAKRTAQKQTTMPKQASTGGKTLMQTVGKKKKAEPQAAKKSPAQLPTKTLMEQRPDREKREEHTKVTASVKPLTANVKPLKNAFENDEHCEHRIQLNPNIQYSKQQQNTEAQRAAIVKTDGESIVQGIIWSEILGKPKAYQNRAGRMGR